MEDFPDLSDCQVVDEFDIHACDATVASSDSEVEFLGVAPHNAVVDPRPPAPVPFRFCAKKIFLTYPRCTLSPERLVSELQEACGVLKEYWVAQERHVDGEPHLHAVLVFDKVVDTRNAHFFDVAGFHPNVQRIRNLRWTIAYVCKGGQLMHVGFRTQRVLLY